VLNASGSSDIAVDITIDDSVRALFDRVGPFDAVASVTGKAPYLLVTCEATVRHFAEVFAIKLNGQINLVLTGGPHFTDGGSFTQTTGILAQDAVPGSVIAGTVNAGHEAFVNTAALDLPRGLRINVVSSQRSRADFDPGGARS
jgi:hypothetical protein